MTIQSSHECPLSLLSDSRIWNDYSYALVHLFDEYPEYCDFFKEEKKLGRKVLLDNSIFELGVAFDSDKFAKRIEEYLPTEYIVPDALEDCDKTISQFESWMKEYKNLPGKKIGAVQGKTYEEFVKCYQYMAEHADKIAISFDFSLYSTWIEDTNITTNQMLGRFQLLSLLQEGNLINREKPHHLLGCSNPMEFALYIDHPGFDFIESIDSSSPIVHAILGEKYPRFLNDWTKKRVKLVDLITTKKEDIDPDILSYNIRRFKELLTEAK
jgi:hypothetical protein